MSQKDIHFRDVADQRRDPLSIIDESQLIPLDALENGPTLDAPSEQWLETYNFSLDGYSDFAAVGFSQRGNFIFFIKRLPVSVTSGIRMVLTNDEMGAPIIF